MLNILDAIKGLEPFTYKISTKYTQNIFVCIMCNVYLTNPSQISYTNFEYV